MIHFNALDFNVCRSKEVISFFWRSVYYVSLSHVSANILGYTYTLTFDIKSDSQTQVHIAWFWLAGRRVMVGL